MLISNELSSYLINESASVFDALKLIEKNRHRSVFTIDEFGHLSGVLSDGDIRRWIISGQEFSLLEPVSSFRRPDCVSVKQGVSRDSIQKLFKDGIELIPIIDEKERVSAVALSDANGFFIGDREVGDNCPAFVIAEIGNNHQGSLDMAKRLVDLAADAGADCVKFQLRDMEALYGDLDTESASFDLGLEYTLDLLAKYQLNDDELFRILEYVESLGLTALCTPWDLSSARKLADWGVSAYKIASADLTNTELLRYLIAQNRPLICSTGMTVDSEISTAVEFLKTGYGGFALLHCNSTYPAPVSDINLRYMLKLGDYSPEVIGYSGHEIGWSVPLAAVTLGAKIIEKHFTLDRALEGNDHKVSLLPNEFKSMVNMIREVELSLSGFSDARIMSQGEMLNRETLAKSMFASSAIIKGQKITRASIKVASPGSGLQPIYMEQLIGQEAIRDMSPGDMFYQSDLSGQAISPKARYSFSRPYGVPARYHDVSTIVGKCDLVFVEFHLSYRDLQVSNSMLESISASVSDFSVHSPELFGDDHILDLASDNVSYRNKSIQNLELVVDHVQRLRAALDVADDTLLVINVGGASDGDFVDPDFKSKFYDRVASGLNSVDFAGIRPVIQTMPPFPWHFGGRRYHNLFICPHEIRDFCERYGAEICLDVSHSSMACNYFGWDLAEFIAIVGEFVPYVHISDSRGNDQEGLQIGAGTIEFSSLIESLKIHCEFARFIPEIWQGHKNEGEGFWVALNRLERLGL